MNGIIINPNALESVIASSKIALFLAEKFGIKIYGKVNFKECKKTKFDYVFVMNSGFGAVIDKDFGMWIANTAKASNHPVYICNDYKLFYPAGCVRYIDPKKYTFWSTIPDMTNRLCKKNIYVNWNKLSYKPTKPRKGSVLNKCIYWGAYRKDRIEFFKKYLNHPDVVISTSSRARKGFLESCPKAKIIPNFESLHTAIQRYACTIYLEDTTRLYCSPANRFYEAISAGIPMLFQPEAVAHMNEAGYDVEVFTVKDAKELSQHIPEAHNAMDEQEEWQRDYIKELHKEVEEALRRTK